ncbi:MAG: hypothetical protein Q8M37_09315 [Nevskia sp.]|nr:hypothetical protein [Nevskia sp.]
MIDKEQNVNEQPDPQDSVPDDSQASADAQGRTPVDPEQLAFLTRHMGRVIGNDEWSAALGRPNDQPLGGN